MSAVADATPDSRFLAGGTTLIDLMKLDVMRPDRLLDISALEGGRFEFIEWRGDRLRIGALTPMALVADDRRIRGRVPVLADSLWLAASQQIRNMARVGGNVLQRTRCGYFRDTSYAECNKRKPGSGCSALRGGISRPHAILGTSSECIATYPGDFAQALIALDAVVEILGKKGPRSLRFVDLHRLPASRPDLETNLQPGDLIVAFDIPDANFPRSKYLKIRDRASYEFALASAAVALRLANGLVDDVRLALGGVATVPWRAREAEGQLRGKPLDDERLREAANLAFATAKTTRENAFKVELGKQTLIRAIRETARMEA